MAWRDITPRKLDADVSPHDSAAPTWLRFVPDDLPEPSAAATPSPSSDPVLRVWVITVNAALGLAALGALMFNSDMRVLGIVAVVVGCAGALFAVGDARED